MERLRQRCAVARQAYARLLEAAPTPEADAIRRDASIQRFEFTFEAVWKAAQQYLRDVEGLDVGSPKAAARACGDVGLLTRDEVRAALVHVRRQEPDGAHLR